MQRIQRRTTIITLVTLAADGLVLFGSLLLAYWVSFLSPLTDLFPVTRGLPPLAEYVKAFPAILMVCLLVFQWFHLYRRRMFFSPAWHFFTFTKAMTVAIFSLMALTFLYRQEFTYSRRLVAWVWVFSIAFLTAARHLIDRLGVWWWGQYRQPRKILLLGEGPVAERLFANLEANPRWGGRVVGVVWMEREPPPEAFPGTARLGHLSEFQAILERNPVNEVILTRLNLPHRQIMDLILECEKNLVEFKLVPDVFSILTSQVWVTNLDGVPLLGLKDLPLNSAWNRFFKRAFDLMGAAVSLVVSAPVLLGCAALIKLTSKGSVFFRQERMGENGKSFWLYKLRTMPMNVEKETGPVWPRNDDPRATPFGRWLRRLGLDELPQLWNVLRGDMSLVGPRPERPIFVEQFKEDVPRYMSRHLVKSGVTGWAQVNGLRGDTSVKTRVEYDMYYLENWSIFFDLKILLLTMFSRRSRQGQRESKASATF